MLTRCTALARSARAVTRATRATRLSSGVAAQSATRLGASADPADGVDPPSLAERAVGAALVAATLFALYGGASHLLAWPEPLPSILAAAEADGELRTLMGGAVRANAWEWAGSVGATTAAVRVPLSGPSGRRAELSCRAARATPAPGATEPGAWRLLTVSARVFAADGSVEGIHDVPLPAAPPAAAAAAQLAPAPAPSASR